MVFPHLFYCFCRCLRGPLGPAIDLVAPPDQPRMEDRTYLGHRDAKLVFVSNDR